VVKDLHKFQLSFEGGEKVDVPIGSEYIQKNKMSMGAKEVLEEKTKDTKRLG